MPHVLVAGNIHREGIEVLRAAQDLSFEVVDEVSTEAYAPLVGRADAILIRTQPMPASVIAEAKLLKLVSRHGVGFDAVDVGALNVRKIPLTIVGDVNSVSVAEHTIMLMLAVAHGTSAYDAATREGRWTYRNTFEARELFGKTVLVVGFGRIGKAVARLCDAFGMRVLLHDPFVPGERIEAAGFLSAPVLRDALPQIDVVTLHVPRIEGGALIGAEELGLLKEDAIVINTARGGLVDEAALADALNAGRLRGAGVDVFETEPPRPDDPLLSCRGAVLSPHSAGLTEECAARMAVSAARNIVDFFSHRLDRSLVVNAAEIGLPARLTEGA